MEGKTEERLFQISLVNPFSCRRGDLAPTYSAAIYIFTTFLCSSSLGPTAMFLLHWRLEARQAKEAKAKIYQLS